MQQISAEDLKLLFIGAASTLLATGVIALIVNWFKKKANVIWALEEFEGELQKKDGKIGVSIYRLVLENTQGGTAKETLVIFPLIDVEFKVKRITRTQLMSSNTLVSNDLSYRKIQEDKATKLVIPDLEGHSIALVTFAADHSTFAHPRSVTFDGKNARDQDIELPFLRFRDFVKSGIIKNKVFILLLVIPPLVFAILLETSSK